MAEKKEKRYVSDNAQLMAEWDWEKNNELKFNPHALTLGSNKKVFWKCTRGHEWQAVVSSRVSGCGCPYCSGRLAIKGQNDLKTENPILAMEWNDRKNNGLTPMDVMPNSGKKAWWICSKGHEWQAIIANRNRGYGCPFCSGKKVLKGYNDLLTVAPFLAEEWNYQKNLSFTPKDVTVNSNKKVWWKCSKGHEWQTTIAHRNDGNGCPFCSGKKVLKGYNDLQTLNSHLAKEWNYTKNGNLKPENFTEHSGKRVWWKCNKGHEWQATINDRSRSIGCPVCNMERKTSFPEYALVFYFRKYGLDVIHLYKGRGYELDIYIPSKNTAIEFDGYFWHKNKPQKDIEKNLKCKNDGIKLYRIREELFPLNDSSIDYVVQKSHKNLSSIFEKILSEIMGVRVDIDLERDAIAINNLREYFEKEKSLLLLNPEIASEWNYEKNGNLKPEYFTPNSEKKVWWNCEKGHEWQATIANRNNKRKCPYCSGRSVLKGYNDLQTVNPTLANEWNIDRNNKLTPESVLPNSQKKVWWKCHKGHEWQATIASRNRGNGCPYCSGRFATKGENDLQSVNPILAREWNYEKNIGLVPADVLPNSNKKVWWKCSLGHEWQAIISNRNKRGDNCPMCRKKH